MIILSLFAAGFSAFAQSETEYQKRMQEKMLNPYHRESGDKTDINTFVRDSLKTMKKESDLKRNLLEKAVNPKEYLVGPGDIINLSIISANSPTYDIEISPEGKAVVPNAGVVDLNGKTLEEATKAITELASRVYKSNGIYAVLKEIRHFKVMVSGNVTNPTSVVVTAADRVSDAIDLAGGVLPDASLRKIYLKRNGKQIRVDLMKFLLAGDLASNPTLLGGDYIIVTPQSESETVSIYGEVCLPGIFEYNPGDSLSTLLRFSQGMQVSAFKDSVEYVHLNQSNDQFETEYVNLRSDYSKLISGQPSAVDFPLSAGDRVYVRRKEKWEQNKYVIVRGEVRYPGYYAITEGKDRMSDLIERFGGFKEEASVDNVVMIRQEELLKDDPEMKRLNSIPPSEMDKSEKRYYQSRISEIKGIISLNMYKIQQNSDSKENIYLRGLDSLYVPKKNSFVNVQGRVNNPGLILYSENNTYLDYINTAGGLGYRADEDQILIIKQKGQQFNAKKKNYKIEPGDYILVPPKSELTFFEIFTTTLTILTQLMTIGGVVYTIIRK